MQLEGHAMHCWVLHRMNQTAVDTAMKTMMKMMPAWLLSNMTLNSSSRRAVSFFVGVIANVGITGSIPSEFGLLSVYLEISLRTEFSLMTKLEELYVYDLQELAGTIPTELGSLSLLFELELRKCIFCPSIGATFVVCMYRWDGIDFPF